MLRLYLKIAADVRSSDLLFALPSNGSDVPASSCLYRLRTPAYLTLGILFNFVAVAVCAER